MGSTGSAPTGPGKKRGRLPDEKRTANAKGRIFAGCHLYRSTRGRVSTWSILERQGRKKKTISLTQAERFQTVMLTESEEIRKAGIRRKKKQAKSAGGDRTNLRG